MEAQVVEGGVKFAAVDQRDLEYDLTLYQRDRGELDWDQRSIATTHILGGEPQSQFYANPSGRGSPAPSAFGRASPAPTYDRYLARGPTHSNAASEIELSHINASNPDQLPLLMTQQGYFDGAPPPAVSGPHYQHSPLSGSPHSGTPGGGAQYPPAPAMYRNEGDGYREAPVHRPYPHNRQTSNYSQHSRETPSHSSQAHYSQVNGNQPPNMAGRGVYRGQ
jgi:hypothetical protein